MNKSTKNLTIGIATVTTAIICYKIVERFQKKKQKKSEFLNFASAILGGIAGYGVSKIIFREKTEKQLLADDTLKTEELQDFSNENSTETVIEEEKLQEDVLDFEEVSVESEIKPQTVEGYFYMKDTGEYVCKVGNSNNAYTVTKKANEYMEEDVQDLKISNDELNIFANSVAQESSGNKFETFAIASAINNLSKYRKKTILKTLQTEGVFGYNDGGNSTKYKNLKNSVAAVINTLLGGIDYSNGAIRWDGFDLAAKGFDHDKPKNCGVTISENLFNKFKKAWSSDFIDRYSGGKYKTFSSNFEFGDYKAKERNIGMILYEASAVYGKTIFWKIKKK